jgi:hypothetical protein
MTAPAHRATARTPVYASVRRTRVRRRRVRTGGRRRSGTPRPGG